MIEQQPDEIESYIPLTSQAVLAVTFLLLSWLKTIYVFHHSSKREELVKTFTKLHDGRILIIQHYDLTFFAECLHMK